MNNAILITVPANKAGLVREIRNSLVQESSIRARIQGPAGGPPLGNVDEVKLVIETTPAADAGRAIVAVVERIMEQIDRIRQRGQVSGAYAEGRSGEKLPLAKVNRFWLYREMDALGLYGDVRASL
jgi:hypothetical protein